MIPKECNIIGKGGHWVVERILVNDNGQKISVVRKHGKPGKADDNIAAFNLVSKAGLPTLNRYVKVNDMEIEAEDLNADTSKGYFVSPNTIRSCQNCGELFIKFIKSENLSPLEIEQCKEFDFGSILKIISEKDAEGVDVEGIFDQLREKRIVFGAEGEVYNNKIRYISNLESFWLSSKEDLKKASLNKIELYTDAFFFRVNPLNNEIEYTIADFDCIRELSRFPNCYNDLIEGNKDNLKTALLEYLQFFVIEERQEEYRTLVNSFR